MKLTSKLGKTLGFAVLCALATQPASAQSQTVNNGSKITTTELTTNGYGYPDDLVAGASHTQLANYAWRLFIASMQNTAATLSNGAGRGMGTSTSNFIDSGKTPYSGSTATSGFINPLVFESLYHRTEAFPCYKPAPGFTPTYPDPSGTVRCNSGNKPNSPLHMPPAYYPYYIDTSENHVQNPLMKTTYVLLDETNQIGQNMLYYRQSSDPDFPVLFMAKVNGTELNHVWDFGYIPTANNSLVLPNGSLEVKTAWRRLSGIPSADHGKYHVSTASYYESNGKDEKPTLKSDDFALIGIHIIQKTANYPNFIFTTFEHVDAVTRDNRNMITDPAFQLLYDQLNYDSGTSNPHYASPNGAYYMNEPNLPKATNALAQYQLPNSGTTSMTDYTTVVQPKTITAEVNDVNNEVYKTLNDYCAGTGIDCGNNVWANYRLKGVQGVPSSQEGTLDYYLANIVVESSRPGIQLFRGGVIGPVKNGSKNVFTNNRLQGNISNGLVENKPVPAQSYTMGGCQGCHGRAQAAGQDFSFLASSTTGVGKELDSVAGSGMSAEAKAAHNQKMAQDNPQYKSK